MLNHVVLAMQREHPFDCYVIPPSNKANFRRRGFHPIEQLTRGSALKKIARVYSQANRKIADQRTLAARESAGNTAMAFSVPSGHGDLLLVDDVLTTGATMAELGRAATNAGYRIRGMCVIARR
jgi:predicted amidophosphoribosyltransferase